MLNNPMIQMFINQTISKNPQAKQLYENLKGKSTEELKIESKRFKEESKERIESLMKAFN